MLSQTVLVSSIHGFPRDRRGVVSTPSPAQHHRNSLPRAANLSKGSSRTDARASPPDVWAQLVVDLHGSNRHLGPIFVGLHLSRGPTHTKPASP
jgi:hypothetical protein